MLNSEGIHTLDNKTAQPAPTILKVLVALCSCQLAIGIALLVFQIIMGYLGFGKSLSLELQSTCSDSYTISKYQQNNLILNIEIRFVSTCLTVALSLALLLCVIKELVKPARTWRYAWYVLESVNLLGAMVCFGFYLGVILARKGKCSWTVFKMSQLLVLVCLGAGLILLGAIIWVIIVYLIMRENQVYKDNDTNDAKDTNKQNMAENNNQHNKKEGKAIQETKPTDVYELEQFDYKKHREKEAQRKEDEKQKDQERQTNKRSWNQNKDKPEERGINDDNNGFQPKQEQQKSVVYNYSPQKHQDNRQYLLNKYSGSESKSIYASNSKVSHEQDPNRKSIYQRPQSNGLKTPPSKKSPPRLGFSKFQNNSGQSEQHNLGGYDRSLARSRLREEEANYLAENSNRKIIPSGGYEGSRPKLHSTYFKEESALLKKNKFEQEKPLKRNKKGILNEYIMQRYID